jgi:outer membrane protein OmpA-like peptidoglycan-associated protein
MMATAENLLNTTQDFLRPEFLTKVSTALGQPQEKIKDGLQSVIPTFLWELVYKGSSPEGAESLILLAQKDGVATTDPENLDDAIYLQKGDDALKGIFGNRLNSITSSLGLTTGLNAHSITKMMRMIAPILMGVIERKVKNEEMSVDGLMGFLGQQKSVLQGFPPRKKIARPVTSYATTDGVIPHYAARGKVWGLLAVVALLMVAIVWWWTSRLPSVTRTPGENISALTESSDPSLTPIAVNLAADLDQLGVFLSSGSEAELPKRFRFEDLNFGKGEAELLAGTESELDAIAQALKENPAALIRIEAFTNNVGNPTTNQELSENRAVIVKEELVAREIESERIEAVGRGEDAPLAPNEAEQGRAINRRVELIVTGIK